MTCHFYECIIKINNLSKEIHANTKSGHLHTKVLVMNCGFNFKLNVYNT